MIGRRVLQRRSVHTLTLGIRREDPTRIWERRCPLTPLAVHDLVRQGVRVLVQPCNRRVFPLRDFVEAGAESHDTLHPAHVVLGIKETPLPELERLLDPVDGERRTHVMFSHTIKGQPYNMGLLARFLREENSPTLIDHELLTNDKGSRTVGFGWFAGAAGAVEGLIASAHDHLQLGIASPFLHLARPYTHTSLASMLDAVRNLKPVPTPLAPFVIAVTGRGNVARGALDVFRELPGLKEIPASALPDLVARPSDATANVYLVHAQPEDYIFRKDGGKYDRDAYYAHPDQFVSRFHNLIAPYLTLFVNGTGWSPGFPRLMTTEQLGLAVKQARELSPSRFTTIADVSCDIDGGLEFFHRSTTIDDPVYHVPISSPDAKDGVSIMGVDILPTELPADASAHFSEKLSPYLRALLRLPPRDGEDAQCIERALDRASVAREGRLADKFQWLGERVAATSAPPPAETVAATAAAASASFATSGNTISIDVNGTLLRKKRMLLLGSGMVAKPAIDEFLRRSDVSLVVASNAAEEARNLVRGRANAEVVQLDISDGAKLDELIEQADVVVSLLPVPFHVGVAERCIAKGRHMVTASYISPGMRTLHDKAAAAGVLLLNEIGLDPGIDHISAIDLRQRLAAQGSRITHFASFCGGLPAPESAGTDGSGLGYKFSWSPKGVLSAARNCARFKLDGTVYTVDAEDLLRRGSYFPDVPVSNVLALEGLANRDSLGYAATYGLGPVHGLNTLIRGTLRYRGFANLMHAFKGLGLLDGEPQHKFGLDNADWRQLLRRTLANRLGTELRDETSVRSAISDTVDAKDIDGVLASLKWLGLVGTSHVGDLPTPLRGAQTALDHFAALLAWRLRYLPGERDLVVLAHEIVAKAADGAEETWTSQLTVYGSRNESAMSRTVGLPVALAALRVLDGSVGVRGVAGPGDDPDVLCKGILGDLEAAGLGMRESVMKGRGRVSRTLSEARRSTE
ncbi:Saccharopine dehydrogenase-domain-containing protein [Auriculariales sp. MPI-PUGE-AT-0066]|nr:Saccharopine dehydrogenase-domain-containing protein [Auriculariales sp. MPI-PUGE-AT-0066]